jgi:hypothetical protein
VSGGACCVCARGFCWYRLAIDDTQSNQRFMQESIEAPHQLFIEWMIEKMSLNNAWGGGNLRMEACLAYMTCHIWHMWCARTTHWCKNYGDTLYKQSSNLYGQAQCSTRKMPWCNLRKEYYRNPIKSWKFQRIKKNAINFIVRGFENRQIFWNNMKGDVGGKPGGAIADAVKSLWNFFGV